MAILVPFRYILADDEGNVEYTNGPLSRELLNSWDFLFIDILDKTVYEPKSGAWKPMKQSEQLFRNYIDGEG